MNNITRKTFISAVLTLFIVLITGCPQPHDKISKPGSSSPGTTVHGEKIDISEAELLTTLGLTRGSQSASEAAKKIAAQTGKTVGGLTFTEAKYLAYDDKAGTFTVKVKGKKDGKVFDNTFTVSGFVHPYKDASPQAMLTPGKKLVLDKAIEVNLSLDKFIEESKTYKGDGYVSFKIQVKVSGKLQEVTFGQHEGYALTARLEKVPDDSKKVKIHGYFDILAEKYENGEKSSESLGGYNLNNIGLPVVEDYFTEEDVFTYIFNKVENDPEFIVTDAGTYASKPYAQAMVLNQGSSLFDARKIKRYKDVYNAEGADKHLKIKDITAGVYNLRNGGVKADDYEGKLTVNFYISKDEYISETNTPPKNQRSQLKLVNQTGFKKLPNNIPNDIQNNAESFLPFNVTKNAGENGTQTSWLGKDIPEVSLISQNGEHYPSAGDWLTTQNILPETDSSGFFLKLGNKSYSDCVSSISTSFLLPASNGNPGILIRQLNVSKTGNNEYLTLKIQFMGKGTVHEVKIKPQHY